jgi:hypothetical protein
MPAICIVRHDDVSGATCPFRTSQQPRIGLARLRHPRHVDGLRVVGDHPLHELDVRDGVACACGDGDGRMRMRARVGGVLGAGGSGHRQDQECRRKDSDSEGSRRAEHGMYTNPEPGAS